MAIRQLIVSIVIVLRPRSVVPGPFHGTNVKSTFIGEDPLWPSLKPADIVKLKSDIENTQLPLYTVQSSLNLLTITATLSGPYYGVRAFGLAFAYSF